MRLGTAFIPFAAAIAATSPASATYIQTTGVIVDNFGSGDFYTNAFALPPATDLTSGERLYFKLEFENAQLVSAQYDQEFSTFSEFWVESSPGVFDLGFGPDVGVANCTIGPNGSCLVTGATIADGTIALSHSGNVLSGFLGFDNVNFDECYGTLFQVVGAICSEDSGVLGPVSQSGVGDLFAIFNTPNGNGRYTFTIYSGGVPEPAAWAMMIAGFGIVGGALRKTTHRRAMSG